MATRGERGGAFIEQPRPTAGRRTRRRSKRSQRNGRPVCSYNNLIGHGIGKEITTGKRLSCVKDAFIDCWSVCAIVSFSVGALTCFISPLFSPSINTGQIHTIITAQRIQKYVPSNSAFFLCIFTFPSENNSQWRSRNAPEVLEISSQRDDFVFKDIYYVQTPLIKGILAALFVSDMT